jgi:hypothetical protein
MRLVLPGKVKLPRVTQAKASEPDQAKLRNELLEQVR